MEKNQTQKSYGLSTLKQARTIIGLASVLFGTLIAILVPLWGRSTFSDLTYDEFRQAYFMPQKNRIADLEAQADFQEAMSKKDMIGLLWLQFAANVLLVAGGLILFWFNAKTEKAYDYAFIILCVICAVMEIVTFAVYYPGIFLDPKTAFGVFNVVVFTIKYLLLFLFSLLWFVLADLENPEYSDNYDKTDGMDGISYLKTAQTNDRYNGYSRGEQPKVEYQKYQEREPLQLRDNSTYKQSESHRSKGLQGSRVNTKIRKYRTFDKLPAPAERYTENDKYYSDSTSSDGTYRLKSPDYREDKPIQFV